MTSERAITDQELKNELTSRKALVVHFSSDIKANSDHFYPNDLHHAIVNKDKMYLSCCVIWPGHKMKIPGSIGVIFDPSVSHVEHVSNRDSGSMTYSDGTDDADARPLTTVSLRETFNVDESEYNEWRLKGAPVCGIFVVNQNNIQVKCANALENIPTEAAFWAGGPITGPTDISLQDVKNEFPGQPIFTFENGSMLQL